MQKLLDIKLDERFCFGSRYCNYLDGYHQDWPDLEPFVSFIRYEKTRPNIAKAISDLV